MITSQQIEREVCYIAFKLKLINELKIHLISTKINYHVGSDNILIYITFNDKYITSALPKNYEELSLDDLSETLLFSLVKKFCTTEQLFIIEDWS